MTGLNKKKEYGIFYSKNADKLIGNLKEFINKCDVMIDPFAGDNDLLNLFPNNKKIGYDIHPKHKGTIKLNTLLYPPNYSNKTIITNPPWLAKNKTKQREIFNKYDVDDIYKAAILSILDCKNGILILPINFLCSKHTKVRNKFLKTFKIIRVNIFKYQIFPDTKYNTCSFYFERRGENDVNKPVDIRIHNSPDKIIRKKYHIPFGKDWLEIMNIKSNVKVSRLMKGQKSNSKIFLKAIDNTEKIHLKIRDEPYYGIISDRAFATIVFDREFTIKQQEIIVENFNELLKKYRDKYDSLFLTNYRENNRKRITFNEAFKLIQYIIKIKLGVS